MMMQQKVYQIEGRLRYSALSRMGGNSKNKCYTLHVGHMMTGWKDSHFLKPQNQHMRKKKKLKGGMYAIVKAAYAIGKVR